VAWNAVRGCGCRSRAARPDVATTPKGTQKETPPPPGPSAWPRLLRDVSGEHVADAGDAAVFAAHHGEPFQREGRPGTVSQQVLEGLTLDTQMETKERDPDAGVHRETTVLASEHIAGRPAPAPSLQSCSARRLPRCGAGVSLAVGQASACHARTRPSRLGVTPYRLAGRSLRPSWASLTRMCLRCAIHRSAGHIRRLNGRGNPSPPPPWLSTPCRASTAQQRTPRIDLERGGVEDRHRLRERAYGCTSHAQPLADLVECAGSLEIAQVAYLPSQI